MSLIRLSTEVQSEYNAWIEALERAGCSVKVLRCFRWLNHTHKGALLLPGTPVYSHLAPPVCLTKAETVCASLAPPHPPSAAHG